MKKGILLTVLIFTFSVFGNVLFAKDPVADMPVGLNIGNKAPEISEAGVDGKVINLSDLKGKLVLIDFWASWCGPCRRENPDVVAAYKKNKDKHFKNGKGFTVFSISLDQNKPSWEAAIAKDQLEWPYHVSDLKGWYAKYAGIYQVNSIPSNFLVDENGIIIAKNLRGAMLDQVLSQLVK